MAELPNSNKIKYGELHIYYPIKFETKLDYSRLCHVLEEKSIVYSEKYRERVIRSVDKMANEADEGLKNHKRRKKAPQSKYVFDGKLTARCTIEDDTISFDVIPKEIQDIEERINRIQIDDEKSSLIYGNVYIQQKRKFILSPLMVVLSNDIIVRLFGILILFSNKMGVLKIELPLMDINLTPIKENDINVFVKEIKSSWKDFEIKKECKLTDLFSEYINKLLDKKISIMKCNGVMVNTIIVDSDELPGDLDNMSKGMREEIYGIVAAPVFKRPSESYSNEACDYLKKHCWGKHGKKTFFSTTGTNMLSIIDKKLYSYFEEKYVETVSFQEITGEERIKMCRRLLNNVVVDIEFAIIILQLKKINEINDIYKKLHSKKALYAIEKEYNENILFINSLQELCFGTVHDQIHQFELVMPHYLKTELSKSSHDALSSILSSIEKRNSEKLDNFISLGSLLVTLVFGMPSIYETAKILKSFMWTNHNIPYLTLENGSFILWTLINASIIIRLIIKKRR